MTAGGSDSWARAVGAAFTSVLLKCSESEFADPALLGARVIGEFERHGLVVARRENRPEHPPDGER